MSSGVVLPEEYNSVVPETSHWFLKAKTITKTQSKDSVSWDNNNSVLGNKKSLISYMNVEFNNSLLCK